MQFSFHCHFSYFLTFTFTFSLPHFHNFPSTVFSLLLLLAPTLYIPEQFNKTQKLFFPFLHLCGRFGSYHFRLSYWTFLWNITGIY